MLYQIAGVLESISTILNIDLLNIHAIFEINIVLFKKMFRLKMIGVFIKLISNKKRGRDLPSIPGNT